jgi:antitoxin (DNA-binding transcriptional repressor) of toxin-antitoxin stability system
MAKVKRKGAEQARAELPALLADAAGGRSTIITRHGKSIAALVPVESLDGRGRQKSIASLAGSGKGLWRRDSSRTLRKLRDEWSR